MAAPGPTMLGLDHLNRQTATPEKTVEDRANTAAGAAKGGNLSPVLPLLVLIVLTICAVAAVQSRQKQRPGGLL